LDKLLIEEDSFLEKCFVKLSTEGRLIAVRRACLMLPPDDPNSTQDNWPQINEKNATSLASAFIEDSSQIVPGWPIEESRLEMVATELKFLCQATSHETRYQTIRNDEKLLNATLSLLRLSLQHQKERARSATTTELFGFESPQATRQNFHLRANLVRLLANMSYKNPTNQKLMRERDGIALVLACVPLDPKNPFITEWSVFALRNLTENCPENQQVIESLKSQGFELKDDHQPESDKENEEN